MVLYFVSSGSRFGKQEDLCTGYRQAIPSLLSKELFRHRSFFKLDLNLLSRDVSGSSLDLSALKKRRVEQFNLSQ